MNLEDYIKQQQGLTIQSQNTLSEQFAPQYQAIRNGYFNQSVDINNMLIKLQTLEIKVQKLERIIFDTKLSQDKIDQLIEVYELCKKIGK